ncbi:MAG: hypothetical protein ACYDD3_10775 [Vulcanimicrobiaceae bacterium]
MVAHHLGLELAHDARVDVSLHAANKKPEAVKATYAIAGKFADRA